MRHAITIAATSAAVSMSSPTYAQMVTADPQIVAKTLQDAGYKAAIGVDSEGDPKISSSTGGYNYTIYFYGCTNAKACKTVQFSAGFTLDGAGISDAKVNSWNRKRRFGTMYKDDDSDPIVKYDLDLEDGGMSTSLFVDNIEYWDTTVQEVAKYVFDDTLQTAD